MHHAPPRVCAHALSISPKISSKVSGGCAPDSLSSLLMMKKGTPLLAKARGAVEGEAEVCRSITRSKVARRMVTWQGGCLDQKTGMQHKAGAEYGEREADHGVREERTMVRERQTMV